MDDRPFGPARACPICGGAGTLQRVEAERAIEVHGRAIRVPGVPQDLCLRCGTAFTGPAWGHMERGAIAAAEALLGPPAAGAAPPPVFRTYAITVATGDPQLPELVLYRDIRDEDAAHDVAALRGLPAVRDVTPHRRPGEAWGDFLAATEGLAYDGRGASPAGASQ